jgi:fructosamine-3-kinase
MVRTLVVQLAGEEFSPQDDATASLTLDASLFSARRVRHFLDSLASRNLLLRAQWTLRALVAQNRGEHRPAPTPVHDAGVPARESNA